MLNECSSIRIVLASHLNKGSTLKRKNFVPSCLLLKEKNCLQGQTLFL